MRPWRAEAARAVALPRAAGVLEDPPSILEMNVRQLQRLGYQGIVVLWLVDAVGAWDSRPDQTPADVLKTESRERTSTS